MTAVDAAAQAVARNWTGWEQTDPPRRRSDGWEVDVHRADGSVVEVNLGPTLELLELDEELGPGGGPPTTRVTGELRVRAIAVAHAAGAARCAASSSNATARSRSTSSARTERFEVDLDPDLRVTGLDREELGDE